jgi:hypothetical protein
MLKGQRQLRQAIAIRHRRWKRVITLTASMAALTATLWALSTAAQTPAAVPFKATASDIVAGDRVLTLKIDSAASKAITAWAVRLTYTSATGKRWIATHTTDGYIAADLRAKSMIEPGGSHSLKIGTPDPDVTRVEVTPLTAVFEDLTYAGDTTVAEKILATRAMERDELQRWVARRAPQATLADGRRLGHLTDSERRAVPLRVMAKAAGPSDLSASARDLRQDIRAGGPLTRVGKNWDYSLSLLDEIRPEGRQVTADKLVEVLDIQLENAVAHTRRAGR